jgi:hypothetical protein
MLKQRFIVLYLLASLLQLASSGCATANKEPTTKPINTSAAAMPNRIAFVSFKALPDSILKLGTTIANGTLKKPKPEQYSEQMALLNYRLLDDKMQVLEENTLAHPLYPNYEFEKDNRELERKTFSLKEAEFFLRITYTPAIRYIDFSEKVNSKTRHLALLPIQ